MMTIIKEAPPTGLPKAAYLFVGAVLVLLLVISIAGYAFTQTQGDREQEQHIALATQKCIAQLQSDVLKAFGLSLTAQGTDRTESVNEIVRTAKWLGLADKLCRERNGEVSLPPREDRPEVSVPLTQPSSG